MGVFVAHLAVIMMIERYRWSNRPAPAPTPVPLSMVEQVVTDPKTGAKIVNREITVSTKLRSEVYRGKDDERAEK